MVVVDDVMLFWLLCCVGDRNKRGVIVALLVDPLALVVVEVVLLVQIRLICFCLLLLLLCDRVFFTKCRFVYLSPMLSVIRIMLVACSWSVQFLCIRVVECSILYSIVARVRV